MKRKKYNFAVINFFRVTEPYSGASEVSYYFFKNLPARKKKLFQYSDNLKKYKNVESFKIKNTPLQKLINLKKISRSVLKFLKNKKDTVIIIEGASWAGYSYIIYKLLKSKLKKTKFIYHSHNVEYLLREKKGNLFITILTKYFEKYICTNFDIFTSVSKKDKREIKKIYNHKSVILSNGTEIKNLKSIKLKKFNFKYIFFCGSIEYKPNFLALSRLVMDIMPRVYENNKNIKLIVSGDNFIPFKEKFLINAGFLKKRVFFEYLKSASLFINPIEIGFGSQLKLINALCLGKTIISTKVALNGLDLNENFRNIFIANDNESFSKFILNKINSKNFDKNISKYYLEKYSMKNITDNFFEQNLS